MLYLPTSAWTETTQTFLPFKMGSSHGESIRRDGECRLLFIIACEGHDRLQSGLRKLFGFTKLCDTRAPSPKTCSMCRSLEYECWEWILTKSSSIRDSETETTPPPVKASNTPVNRTLARLDDYNYDFFSQSLSEGTTRGIFESLRSAGYPRNEKPI